MRCLLRIVRNEDGDVAVAMLLFMMMLCALAVIGYDFARAHTVRERLKTATDAAALAACMQAQPIPDAVAINIVNGQPVMVVSKWDMDLSNPNTRQSAAHAAAKALSQNLLGTEMPLGMVAFPQVTGLPPGASSSVLPYQATVDWSCPQQSAMGGTYYSKYRVTAGMAVKTLFAAGVFSHPLFRNGIVSGATYGQSWRGAIPIDASGTAQAISP